jgi:multimeric flavodoxin WrbA
VDGGGAVRVRVLGIAGSPRRHGNSDSLLEACLAGARDAGAETGTLVVAEAGIAPCRGCNECSSTGACVVRDGMSAVYPRLDAADAIVVATPVYFATVPAVLKALYDRCQPYWARRYVLHEEPPPRRPGALLVVGGGGDPYGHECAVRTTRSVFAVLSLDYVAEVVVEADSPSDARRHPDALARAREAGAGLVAEALLRRGAGS